MCAVDITVTRDVEGIREEGEAGIGMKRAIGGSWSCAAEAVPRLTRRQTALFTAALFTLVRFDNVTQLTKNLL